MPTTQYSLLDTETYRCIENLSNYTDREKLVEEAFDYATEGNDCIEVNDWIQAGGDKEGALTILNYKIIQT